MLPEPVNFDQKFTLFNDFWSPRIVARMNDYDLKIVQIQGEFVWHSHPETDEVFIVLAGTLRIDFRDGQVPVSAGEMVVVPKALEHRPVAEQTCRLLLIEPQGTVNTGDYEGLEGTRGAWV